MKKRDINRKVLMSIAIIVIVISIIQTIALNIYTYKLTHPGMQTRAATNVGSVKFCLNNPPTINVSNCSHYAYQDRNYYCKLTSKDVDGPLAIFSSTFIGNKTLFNVTPEGVINFTPGKEDIGNYTIYFTVNDGSNCDNGHDSTLFELKVINLNDPPYLIKPLPSFGLVEGSLIVPFYLLDYFNDSDLKYGDHLSFLYSKNDSKISITIDATSRVLVKASDCPFRALAIFTAVDDYNATANSNPVYINVNCQGETGQGAAGAGGGFGGGGFPRMCIPDWQCGPWHQCMPNGTQYRKCIDKNVCDIDNYEHYIWRNCTYYAQCFNGIKDENEEGIDCGGPCPPCGSCFDGIKNCHDGSCEEGVDCGGPCDPCGSCFDGIKNCHDGSCEEGIDCGGPCKPCVHVEKPFIKQNKFWTNILAMIIAFLSLVGVIYVYFKREIDIAIDYLLQPLKKRRRKAILLKRSDALKLLGYHHLLFEQLLRINKTINTKEPREVLKEILSTYQKLFSIRRELLSTMFGLSIEFTENEIYKKIRKKAMPKSLKNWLKLLVTELFQAEKDINEYIFSINSIAINELLKKILREKEIKKSEKEFLNIIYKHYLNNIASIIEQQRSLIISTSNIYIDEIKHLHKIEKEELSKKQVKNHVLEQLIELDRFIRISYLSLQFGLVDKAIDTYILILKIYESLPLIVQSRYYFMIKSLRHAINYYQLLPKEERKTFKEKNKTIKRGGGKKK